MLKNIITTDIMEKNTFFLLFFFFCSLAGWSWEISVYWFSHSSRPEFWQLLYEFRGVLHGPWVPIYGSGCILILCVKQYVRKSPLHFFIASSLICGILEYSASWLLEYIYHARWWDYSNQFLNINGRISLLSVVFFGFAGIAVAYGLEPLFKKLLGRISLHGRIIFAAVLLMLFLADCYSSLAVPNMGIGVAYLGGGL